MGIDTDTQWVWVFTTGFVTALLIVVALAAKPSTPKEGMFLGFVWAAVFLLLDLLIVALPLTGLDYFMDFRAWIPYILGIVGTINSKKQ